MLSKKHFFEAEQIFPETLTRRSKNDVGGHVINQILQPAVFVSSLKGAGLWNAEFGGRARTIFGRFVFDFFDSIGL